MKSIFYQGIAEYGHIITLGEKLEATDGATYTISDDKVIETIELNTLINSM